MPVTNTERKFFNEVETKSELRVTRRDGKSPMIVGYPAKFNRLSQNLGGFRENILPGAFKRTIAAGADVRALLNHNPDLILGRTGPGTLRLVEDSIGLRMEIDPPDTQLARDLMTSIDRGDIDQGSFRFRCMTDAWRTQDGKSIRDLKDVDLEDVSVVTFPAYLDTSADIRSAEATGLDFERLAAILVKVKHAFALTPEERSFFKATLTQFHSVNVALDTTPGSLRRAALALAQRGL